MLAGRQANGIIFTTMQKFEESHEALSERNKTAIQTIKTLKSILGDDAVDIQHIRSTAILAIKAKLIIDIAIGVTDFEKIMSHNEQLQKESFIVARMWNIRFFM